MGTRDAVFNSQSGEGYHVTFDPVKAPDRSKPEDGLVFNEHWYRALDLVLLTAGASTRPCLTST